MIYTVKVDLLTPAKMLDINYEGDLLYQVDASDPDDACRKGMCNACYDFLSMYGNPFDMFNNTKIVFRYGRVKEIRRGIHKDNNDEKF